MQATYHNPEIPGSSFKTMDEAKKPKTEAATPKAPAKPKE